MRCAGVLVAAVAAAGCHSGPGRCDRVPGRIASCPPTVEILRCPDVPAAPAPVPAAPPRVVTAAPPCPAPVAVAAEPACHPAAKSGRAVFAFTPTVLRMPVPWLRVERLHAADDTRCGPRCDPPHAHAAAGFPQGTVVFALPVGPGGYAVSPGAFPVPTPPVAVAPVPVGPTLTPERVEALTRRIEELEAQLRATQQPVSLPPVVPTAPIAP